LMSVEERISALPLLRLEDMMSVRCVKDETLKVEFADATNLWPGLEVAFQVVAYTIGAFEEAHFWG